MNANDLRPGMIIQHNGDLFSIYKAEHRTPGNLRAFVQAKMRNLRSGAMIDHRFRSTDAVDKINLDEVEMQYLYADGDFFHFMNTANYEQIQLHKDVVGDRANYMMPDVLLKVEFLEGKPVDIQLPAVVGVPLITPVTGSRTSPSGSPDAVKRDGSPVAAMRSNSTCTTPLQPRPKAHWVSSPALAS